MSSVRRERVFHRERLLGEVFYDEFLKIAKFRSFQKKLNFLESTCWECPTVARAVIKRHARAVGLA
jgi:hypothetical protein